jgi:hypothetical protein
MLPAVLSANKTTGNGFVVQIKDMSFACAYIPELFA